MTLGATATLLGVLFWWLLSDDSSEPAGMDSAALAANSSANLQESAATAPKAEANEADAIQKAPSKKPQPEDHRAAASPTPNPSPSPAEAATESDGDEPPPDDSPAEPDPTQSPTEDDGEEPPETTASATDAPSDSNPEPGALERDGSLRRARSCEQLTKQPSGRPDQAEKYVAEAEKLFIYGKTSQAHRLYCLTAKLAPDNAKAAIGLAQLLLVERDAQRAAKWAERALELEPHNLRTVKNTLGDSLVRLQQPEAARTLWFDAAGIPEPTSEQQARYLAMRQAQASAAFKRKDYQRAERLYRRVIALDPGNRTAMSRLATILNRSGHPEAAIVWTKRAVNAPASN